jgi:hypothetical protein
LVEYESTLHKPALIEAFEVLVIAAKDSDHYIRTHGINGLKVLSTNGCQEAQDLLIQGISKSNDSQKVPKKTT